MAVLSRRNRLILIKILGLLSIIRWQNVLFTALAQYVAAIYIFTPTTGIWTDLLDLELHLIVLATVLILAGGYIINSFYDVEKDMINRPNKTLFDRIVSKEFSLYTYFAFNAIGLALSALASWRVLIYFSFFAFGLWYYSHKLQKFSIVREVSSAALSVMSVFSIVLYYRYVNWTMVLYGSIFMTVIFNREIVKNIINYVGDKALGLDSIAVRWGIGFSQRLIVLISILSSAAIVAFYLGSTGAWRLHLSSVLIGLLILGIVFSYINRFKLAHIAYKVMMMTLILYLIVY